MSSSPRPRFAETTLSASDSITKIEKAISKYGVRRYGVEKEGDRPVRVYIVAVTPDGREVPILLEAHAESLRGRLYSEKATTSEEDQLSRAYDVAWRQVLAYVEMALEFVINGERSIEEAFMADVGVNVDGQYRRLADVYRERGPGMLALPAASSEDADFEVLE